MPMFSFTPPPHPLPNLQILDTTLRDGLRTPQNLTTPQHTHLLTNLHNLHPDIIELKTLPSPISIQPHHPIHSFLLPPTQKSINQARENVTRLPRPLLHVYTPFPTPSVDTVSRVAKVVTHARTVCPNIQYSPKHAIQLFNNDPSLFTHIIHTAVTSGASIITLTDTAGISTPDNIVKAMKHITAVLAEQDKHVSISVHAHGDRDTVLRNVVAAVQTGASIVECTVSGIGDMPALQDVVRLFGDRTSVRHEFLDECVHSFEECFHLF